MTTPSIQLFVTGGTFDKEYDEIGGRLYFKDSHVGEMLKLGRSSLDIQVQTLLMIDSLDMTDDDRSLILKHCAESTRNHIVITHGTDSMEHTARVLGKAGIAGKTIVLTGAMVPYKFGSSDGLFNLGAALAFVQTLPAGVYVAINGRALSWQNVTKNKSTGEFHAGEN
jgi:L-asparaginase